MSARCPLCGGDRSEPLVPAFDRVVARREDYCFARCPACSLVSLRPAPQDHEIAGLYPAEYAPHAAGRDGRRDSVRARFAARNRFGAEARPRPGLTGRLLHRAAGLAAPDWIDPRGDCRLLEVGCGSGKLLERYRDLGWEVRGIDPGARAVEACRARGLPVQQTSLLEADLPRQRFDAILLHHVIEHVLRPVEALRRARELLAPGGAVVVVTPNVGGLGFRLYGSCWYALDAPRHLHLFDARTLVRASELAGLSVESLRSRPSARVLAASRHYARTQGAVLPPGLAARSAVLARSREEAPSPRFRRSVRPVAWVAAWLGYGESLRAVLVDPGRRP